MERTCSYELQGSVVWNPKHLRAAALTKATAFRGEPSVVFSEVTSHGEYLK